MDFNEEPTADIRRFGARLTDFEPNAENFAYRLDLQEDANGDGVVDWNDEPTITQIECNGDFRNQICIDMLKEADIVVTNPSFSLFRDAR